MSARLAADRQIRAAAFRGAPTLDVRGPISEALARTGIDVPAALADAARAPETPSLDASADRRPAPPTAGKTLGPGLQARAPKPIRPPAKLPPLRVSDGLTADERRVHRILIDALGRDYDTRSGGFGPLLPYVEKKKLEALDLAYIDGQLDAMDRDHDRSDRLLRIGLATGVVVLPVLAFALFQLDADDAVFLVSMLVTLIASVGASFTTRTADASRRKIYEAFRELALAADPGDAPSAAIAEADRIIDRLAFADEAALDATPSTARRVRG